MPILKYRTKPKWEYKVNREGATRIGSFRQESTLDIKHI